MPTQRSHYSICSEVFVCSFEDCPVGSPRVRWVTLLEQFFQRSPVRNLQTFPGKLKALRSSRVDEFLVLQYVIYSAIVTTSCLRRHRLVAGTKFDRRTRPL